MSSEWPLVEISTICEGIFDGPHATPKKTEHGPIFLGISSLNKGRLDLSKLEYLSEDDFTKWTKRVVPKAGDLVFSYETRLGEVAMIPEGLRCCLGRRMALMRINKNKAIPEYVLYTYLSPLFQDVIRARTIHGSTVDRIPLMEFGTFPIHVPPLEVQAGIASVLKALDDRIVLLRETNATLEAIAQALFKSWFVDFDPVHANAGTQAPSLPPEIQALFPATFTDSPQGPIPEGWRISNIGEVCDFQNGYAFKSNEMSKEAENTYKIFKMGNIKKGGGLNRSGTKDYYERNKAASLNRYLIKKGDLLMCMTDMKNNVALLGHTALMDVDDEFLLNQRVGLIRTKNPKIVNYPFLFILTNSDSFLNDIRMRANSGVQVNLSTNEIKSTEFVLPPTDIHSVFNDVVEGLFEKIFVNEQKLDYLSNLRDTLLPRLISGQLRLPEAEQAIAEITD